MNETTTFEERLIDIPEAARLLYLSRASIERLIATGKLKPIYPGGLSAIRFRLSDIRSMMQ